MKHTKRYWWGPVLLAAAMLFPRAALAEDAASQDDPWSRVGGVAALLKLVGSPALPSLLSLVRPHRNVSIGEWRVEDARAEMELLSENQALVVSGNSLLSHIHVTVNIHVNAADSGGGPGRAAPRDRSRGPGRAAPRDRGRKAEAR